MTQPQHYPFHVETPMWATEVNGVKVHLKMDALQPAGSFKARGIGYLCSNAVHKRGCTHLISSSGGNAGYATAFVGKRLGVKVTVVVPESAPELIITKLRKEGAEVIVHGGMWSKAHEKATELASQEGCELIHPFEHEEIWQGHETLIEECNKQLTKKPAAVVCSVGGGGLIIGVLSGMHKVGWGDVPVIAVETEGADSFAQSVKASEMVTLPAITSIAKTLGAARVSEAAFNWTKKHKVIPVVVTDKQAVNALEKFADDHRVLVEPACSATLAAIYDGKVASELLHGADLSDGILAIVCGGNVVSLDLIQMWKRQLQN